jgi:hypothetical protein
MHQHPIAGIVAATPTPSPVPMPLVYKGGPVQTHPVVYTVWLGSGWNDPTAGDPAGMRVLTIDPATSRYAEEPTSSANDTDGSHCSSECRTSRYCRKWRSAAARSPLSR